MNPRGIKCGTASDVTSKRRPPCKSGELKISIFLLSSVVVLLKCSEASVIAVGNLQSCFNSGSAVSEKAICRVRL